MDSRCYLDLSLLDQSRRVVRAASCRPLRSWPLGRRSGRVPALPYPPPRWPQCIAPPRGHAKASLRLGPPPCINHDPFAPPWEPDRLHPAEFHTGVMWTSRWRERNGPGVQAHALAAERSVDLPPGGARPFGCHGCVMATSISNYSCLFSSRTSMSRYCRTRAKLHLST